MKRITAVILAALMVLTVAAGAMGEENRIWGLGDTGDKVTWIQSRLKELEYLEGEATGVFDEETEEALTEFQSDYGLLRTGMADSTTMKALETATEKKSEKRAWYYDDDYCYEEATVDASAYAGKFVMNSAPTATSMPVQAAGMAFSDLPLAMISPAKAPMPTPRIIPHGGKNSIPRMEPMRAHPTYQPSPPVERPNCIFTTSVVPEMTAVS